MTAPLKAPFPWFGGKRRVAPVVWRAFGDPPNYVEPFFGSGAVLLGRPQVGKIETVNDLDCYVANFFRAVSTDPAEVARHADWPVNEADLHAWHAWLTNQTDFRERMHSDPDFFDVKVAGRWVWGLCQWVGSGWCSFGAGWRQLPRLSVNGGGSGHVGGRGGMPSLGHSGRGVHSPERSELNLWFIALQARLRRVRVACGDWSRVVSGAVTGASNTLKNMGMGPCAVFLDPPYPGEAAVYSESVEVAPAVRDWALSNGDNPALRIALCGYAGDHDMPGWTEHAWKATGGYANRNGAEANENAKRERIWFSPGCLPIEAAQTTLFGRSA